MAATSISSLPFVQSIGLKFFKMAENAETIDQTAHEQEQDVNPWSVAGGTDASGNAVSINYEALSR